MSGVEKSIEWLTKFVKPRKTFNTQRGSYKLKHEVERWAGDYVSNEGFIFAAESLGYRKRKIEPGSPNYYFNMSLPRLKYD